MKALDCIVCGGKHRNIDERHNHPDGGLAFSSHGHYGTTVFDPMDGSALEINVCDRCMKEAILQGRVYHHSIMGEITTRDWDRDND